MKTDRQGGRLDPLARHRVPLPPPELAGKVLAAAAMAEAAQAAPTWIDRLWESSPARLLWAATTCALLLGHLIAARPMPVHSSPPDDDRRIDSAVALLDDAASTSPARISNLRVSPFRDYEPILTRRGDIETVLEEWAR